MKTNFVMLKEEDVKALKSMISETEKKTLDREFVLREIRKSLKATNSKLAGIIDANWKRFLELQALQMPHVVYNGKSTPTLVDWVKDPEGKFKLEKAIKAYRHTDDEAQTIVDGCFDGRITRSSVEPVKEVITYKSGYAKEVQSYDEDGNPMTEVVEVTLVPKEKSTWGFTKVMVDAFVAATDDLLEELDRKGETELTNEFVTCADAMGRVIGYQRVNTKGEGAGKIYTEAERDAFKASLA